MAKMRQASRGADYWLSEVFIRWFWSNTARSANGCLEWQRSVNPGGYGQLTYMHEALRAHRVAWRLTNGEIPKNRMVLHKCNNRRCVDPDHLYLGDDQDNKRDIAVSGVQKGVLNPRARFTEADVRSIVQRYLAGETAIAIAKDYSTHRSVVSEIVSGKKWSHLWSPDELEAHKAATASRRRRR